MECDPCGPSEGKNYCIDKWNAHTDIIWELNHHPNEDLLLSSSADGTIKMWDTSQDRSHKILKTFSYRPQI